VHLGGIYRTDESGCNSREIFVKIKMELERRYTRMAVFFEHEMA
jgi:hypothetical protein